MTPTEYVRAGVSLLILCLFGAAYILHPDNALLVGALISMATGAAQFWFGSTATGAKNTENTGKALDLAHAANTDAGKGAQETANAAQKKADQLSGK